MEVCTLAHCFLESYNICLLSSMAEQGPFKPGVVSSNLTGGTIYFNLFYVKRCFMVNRKKRLHPAVFPAHGLVRDDNANGNDIYHDGSFCLFGVNFDIDWNPREKAWNISCPHMLSTAETKIFINNLYELTPESFSDELEYTFSNIGKGQVFYDEKGQSYMVVSDVAANKAAISLDSEGYPTGELKTFYPDDLVYV